MKLLDLFCGVGGAGMGYARAGFDVTGVDARPMPRYPFEFTQANALEILADRKYCAQFDVIHASPPCQASTALTRGANRNAWWAQYPGMAYPQLVPAVQELMQQYRITVIENVVGSDLRPDVVLCGEMFHLEVLRHRVFQIDGLTILAPAHRKHRGGVTQWRNGEWHYGPYFSVYGTGGNQGTIDEWRRAMGIDWTHRRKELAEAIPPAYTQYVGNGILAAMERRHAS